MLSGKYTTKTGLPLVLINANGEIIHSEKKCTMCEQVLRSRNSVLMNNCRLKMLKAVEEAFRWGRGIHHQLSLRADHVRCAYCSE